MNETFSDLQTFVTNKEYPDLKVKPGDVITISTPAKVSDGDLVLTGDGLICKAPEVHPIIGRIMMIGRNYGCS